MNKPAKPATPERGRHLMDEPDIGSGEKTPGEQETEELIRQIPPLPHRTVQPSSEAEAERAPR